MQVKNKLDRDSLIKTAKGAGIAGGAVALLYILEWLVNVDFGESTPIMVGLLSVFINFLREWRKGE